MTRSQRSYEAGRKRHAAFHAELNKQPRYREDCLWAAEQADIDARHARLAAMDVQNPSDRDFALATAARHEQRAREFRAKASGLR